MKTAKFLQTAQTLIEHGLQFLAIGAPAIGKTETIKEACRRAGADLIIMHPVVSDPTDFKGLPALTGKAGEEEANFLPIGDLRKLLTATKKTLCFMDDMGQASNAVQSALMQLILAREINGHKISDHVVFAGATNRRRDKAGVKGILQPLLSRFCSIIEVEVDHKGWVEWALKNEMPPELIAFIQFRPKLLHSFDPNAVSSTGESLINQPAPRTWEAVGHLTKAGLICHEVIAGAVGEAGATEFCGFLAMIKKLGDLPKRILAGESPDCPTDASTIYALSSCLAKFAEKEFNKVSSWIGDKMPLEFAGQFLKDAETRFPQIAEEDGFVDLSLKVNGFLAQ